MSGPLTSFQAATPGAFLLTTIVAFASVRPPVWQFDVTCSNVTS